MPKRGKMGAQGSSKVWGSSKVKGQVREEAGAGTTDGNLAKIEKGKFKYQRTPINSK